MKRTPAILLLLLLALCTCQKVIHVDLNSSDPGFVIIGNVSDEPGPYTVVITRTKNFDESNTFPGVTGALVVITDHTTGIADTLKETVSCNYQTRLLRGVPGHTYQLYVKAGENIFTASSTMPVHVSLDSLFPKTTNFGRETRLVPAYKDPAKIKNYYHLRQFQNDSETQEIFIRADNLTDGQEITTMLGGNPLNPGDSITVYLQTIDLPVYQYYSTLLLTMNQNYGAPANPVSNIVGGALGYFSAHGSSMKVLRLP